MAIIKEFTNYDGSEVLYPVTVAQAVYIDQNTPITNNLLTANDKSIIQNAQLEWQHYQSSSTKIYLRIKINSTVAWMLSFTVNLYSNYEQHRIQISGYNYASTKTWYSPRAQLLSSTSLTSIDVTFAKDGDNDLSVYIPVNGQYSTALITDVVNGNTQVKTSSLFTLTRVTDADVPTENITVITAVMATANSTSGVGRGGTGATSFTNGELLIGNGTGAIGTRAIKNMTSKGNLGWTNANTDIYIPTINTIAYWDGRYNSSTSNLAYCNKGAFGTLATKNSLTASEVGAEPTITGAATSITSDDLTASRVLISNTSGKVAVSAITSTELGYLDGVTSNIQTQINSKQATITGAASSISSDNLTASRALVSNSSGKVVVSNVTSTELGYLDGVTSAIQNQLDGKSPLAGSSSLTTLASAVSFGDSGFRVGSSTIASGKGRAIGWYRIAKVGNNSAGTIYYRGSYSTGWPTSAVVAFSTTHTVASMIQIAGRLKSIFTKLRLVRDSSDGYYFVDAYQSQSYSSSQSMGNQLFTIIGSTPITMYNPTEPTDDTTEPTVEIPIVDMPKSFGLGRFTSEPLSGQVVVTDGISGGIKTTGYTIGSSVPSDAVFTDTTYTFATGDSDGQIKVTPAGGTAQNVSVKGLGSNAYTSTAYAPIESPELTGTPTAPTASIGTDTTQIATTAFVNNSIDAIDIGGRNLVLNSDVEKTSKNNVVNFSLSDYGKALLVNGAVFTVSFDVKVDDPTNTKFDSYLRDSGTAASSASPKFDDLSTEYQRKTYTSTVTKNGILTIAFRTTAAIGNGNTAATFTFRRVKVELGNKATDWTPAPEDMATLASPAFTGTPIAPTADANTNTTQIATTAFVKTAINNLINGAPAAYDTLVEISDYISSHTSEYEALLALTGDKANESEVGAQLDLSNTTLSLLNKSGTTLDSVTLNKANVGLGSVDNTSDANKPISTATQTALDSKQATITGGATTITTSNLTQNRALISNASGKVAVSDVTDTELGYLDGVTSAIQTQLDGKSPVAGSVDLNTLQDDVTFGSKGFRVLSTTIPAGKYSPGWFRIAKLPTYSSTLLLLNGNYGYGKPTSASFAISISYTGATLNQINGRVYDNITKLRLVYSSSAWYLDAYNETDGLSANRNVGTQRFTFICNGNTGPELYSPTEQTDDETAAYVEKSITSSSYVPESGGTMTGELILADEKYPDSYEGGALNLRNQNITNVNSIYTADASNNAAEGIHFYRDTTHVDSLWINAGDILFAPNRELGTSTTKANSQKVGRFTENPVSGQMVIADGTTGGMKTTQMIKASNIAYSVAHTRITSGVTEIILHTGIKWVGSKHMPTLYIHGYGYQLVQNIDLMVSFYLYGSNPTVYNPVSVNRGSIAPEIYIFKYTANEVDYVAIGIKLENACNNVLLAVDVQDDWAKFAQTNLDSDVWTWSQFNSDGNIPAVGTDACKLAPYKANILNPSQVNSHTVNSDVPANAVFTDTTNLGSMTGTLDASHGGTGQTSLGDAANALINALSEGTSAANANDYIVAQYANGGTTTTTYHRRKLSNIFKALNYAASDSSGGSANTLKNFTVTTTTNLGIDTATAGGAIGYVKELTAANWNYNRTDGALYRQAYSSSWNHQIYGDYRTGQISVRGMNDGTWQDWRRILDETNWSIIMTNATQTDNGLLSPDDKTRIDKNTFYVVKGTQTATTAKWTGQINLPALFDGLTIVYYLPRTSASNATLNLTLSDNTTTGEIPIYVTNTTRMGTHYGAGATVYLTYWSAGQIAVNGTATTEDRWTASDYWNSNTLPNEIYYYNTQVAKSAIAANTVIVGDENGYAQVASGVSFDLTYPILFTTAAIAQNETNYANLKQMCYDKNLSCLKSGFTSAKNRAIFLVVTISGHTATISSEVAVDSANLPTTENGKYYILLGKLGNQSTGANYFIFNIHHPIYQYIHGAFREVSQYAQYAGDASTVSGHTVGVDVPSNAVFTDTTALGQMTGTLGVGHGGTGAVTFTSGELLIGNGANAIGTRTIKNMTAKGNLGWTNANTDIYIPTVNTLAYWDGRYNSSSSNLTYCVKGAFGTLATKDSLGKSDVGLGNVDNKSSATIRSEITSSNVTSALGFTPVSLDSDQTITGSKKFTTTQCFVQSGVTKGTAPQNTQYREIICTDATGDMNYANGKRLGAITFHTSASNENCVRMTVFKPGGTTENQSIGIYWGATGNAYTAAPTPAATDSSTKIATTAYVKGLLRSGTANVTTTNCPNGCFYFKYV